MIDFDALELKSTQTLIKFRWPAFVLSCLLIISAAAGLKDFRIDGDITVFFAEDNIFLQRHDKFEAKYGRSDNVRFALQFEDGLYSKENLTILKTFADETWLLPFAQRSDSLANYAYSWSVDDDLFVRELIEDSDQLTDEYIEQIKEISHTDPDLLYRLSTDKAEIAVVDTRIYLPNEDRLAEQEKLALASHALAEKYESKYPNLNIALSGNTISDTSMILTAMKDSKTLIPLMYLIIFVLLFFFLRSISAVFIIWLITASATSAALGMAFHLGYVLNMLSVASMNIVITVSIAHCVHLMNGFLENYRQGEDKTQALIDSMRINLQPIFLTTFTTMLGFLSMNFSNMPPANDLGNISALGVCIAFIISLTLLPALALALPANKNLKIDRKGFQQRMEQLAEFVIENRTRLLIGSALFSIVMLGLLTQNQVNDTFSENIKRPSQFRTDNDLYDKYFGGLYTIEFDFKAASNDTISNPEYLHALEKFSQHARSLPGVTNVRSYTDIIKRLNRNMHGDDPAYYRIPDSKEEAAQYLLLYEFSQPQGSDMTSLIDIDKASTRLVVSTTTMDSRSLRTLGLDMHKWIQDNMPTYMHAEPTSLIYMWTHLAPVSMKSSLSGSLAALFIISVVLTLVFKSLRYGIISLIPNLLPAGIGYGLWALYSGMLQMSQIMVLSITIGIVVDDTVHFLSKYLRARREKNAGPQDAVRYAFKHVGAPLWITTVVLVCGFGLLISSSFVPNSDLGSLTALILVSALFLDFFMLPPLLMWLDKDIPNNKASV